jgi:hypothetical protein
MGNPARIKAATLWLYLLAATTLANSLLLQLSSHFVDLLAGLYLTQMTDAFFFGMRSIEPPGATPALEILFALTVDVVVALFLLILGVQISRGSRRASAIAFFLYTFDTIVLVLAFTLGAVLSSDFRPWTLAWEMLTILVHLAGVAIIFRGWRAIPPRISAKVVVS